MKKISFFLMLIMASVVSLTSCSKDDNAVNSTTYTFLDSDDDISGMSLSVDLIEYNSIGEQIASNYFECKKGSSKIFTASENAEKVKIYVTIESNSKPQSTWIQQIYYLKENNNINIELKGTTMIGPHEP
jgi:hypothetical protein